MKLKSLVHISAILVCETGLRIGGSKDTIEIGGLDNPIIRHPISDIPYIPGSSIKGKLRSLLESVYGRKTKNLQPQVKGEPCSCGLCDVCRVFGPHKNTNHQLGPTRLIVRDAKMTKKSIDLLTEAQQSKGVFFSEIKTENTINRDNGTANNPRQYERIPEGTSFEIEMVLKVYDEDNQQKMINLIKQGLMLLENDYLGSSGSRGYGKVKFDKLEFQEIDVHKIKNMSSEESSS
jgi:CRISPR-associated protein Csm3